MQPPKRRDETPLWGGGPRDGIFWRDCKRRRRCVRPPYDRLLDNPELRVDYRHQLAAREGEGKPRGEGGGRTDTNPSR